MKEFTYVIKDELGIHARPAGQLVKLASGLSSKVSITKGEKTGDAKKIFSVMGLAVKQGDEIKVSVEGDSEAEDAATLQEFIEKTF